MKLRNDIKIKPNRFSYLREEWPVLVSLVGIIILSSVLAGSMVDMLPSQFRSLFIFRLISLLLSGILVLIIILAWQQRIARVAIIIFSSITTVYLIFGVILLVESLSTLKGNQGGLILLSDAAIVWVINVLVFAIWFWIVDGGGPTKRGNSEPQRKDFLFPQEALKIPGWERWKPSYTSYLFIAFHNSSTFGPTDTYVLSDRAKIFVTAQVIISLITLTMFAARALTIIA